MLLYCYRRGGPLLVGVRSKIKLATNAFPIIISGGRQTTQNFILLSRSYPRFDVCCSQYYFENANILLIDAPKVPLDEIFRDYLIVLTIIPMVLNFLHKLSLSTVIFPLEFIQKD